MHPAGVYHWTDRAELRAFVRDRAFGAVFLTTPEGPRVAHVPVTFLDDDHIGFHLSRGNAMTPCLHGARALFVAHGPDSYVSPDWYGIADQVPTWNYVAAELEGTVQQLSDDALPALIDQLTAELERGLTPKSAWTRDKMADGLFDKMLRAIHGYRLRITDWRGTRKLGQTLPETARRNLMDALIAQGETALAGWTPQI